MASLVGRLGLHLEASSEEGLVESPLLGAVARGGYPFPSQLVDETLADAELREFNDLTPIRHRFASTE